jgi:hypothetical protein
MLRAGTGSPRVQAVRGGTLLRLPRWYSRSILCCLLLLFSLLLSSLVFHSVLFYFILLRSLLSFLSSLLFIFACFHSPLLFYFLLFYYTNFILFPLFVTRTVCVHPVRYPTDHQGAVLRYPENISFFKISCPLQQSSLLVNVSIKYSDPLRGQKLRTFGLIFYVRDS